MGYAGVSAFSIAHHVSTPTGLAVVATGTLGSTHYGYRIEALDEVGGRSIACAEVSASNGNAALGTGSNYVSLSWAEVSGAASYNVFRSTGGSTQGFLINVSAATSRSLNDTGLVTGSAIVAATANTSGLGERLNVIGWQDNVIQVGSGFSGSLTVQSTINGADWVDKLVATDGTNVCHVSGSWVSMRVKMTSFASGSVAVACAHF